MRNLARRALIGLTVAGLLAPMAVTEASAATARHYYNKGHSGYVHRGYATRHYGRRSNVGPAVAGAALGLFGAVAGAAIASRGYDEDDGYGGGYEGGYPYGGPAYSYGGYGPAPYTYGGYGYGYQPF